MSTQIKISKTVVRLAARNAIEAIHAVRASRWRVMIAREMDRRARLRSTWFFFWLTPLTAEETKELIRDKARWTPDYFATAQEDRLQTLRSLAGVYLADEMMYLSAEDWNLLHNKF